MLIFKVLLTNMSNDTWLTQWPQLRKEGLSFRPLMALPVCCNTVGVKQKVSISNVEAGRGEDGGVAEGQRGVPVPAEEAAAQVGPVHGIQLAAGGYPIK